ncbi:hypothetical protein CVT91_11680 [Candidatus Atribacteria bacterium HGW-Atribacteria-1]|nr:MAG: hypothetical protein CVT91_11680 [Candidatus Atribacteria bacterium HGW-Atribacteria-1]
MKKVLFLIVSLLILGLVFVGCSNIANITTPGSDPLEKNGKPTPTYTEVWDGRGTDSEDCSKVGDGPRTEDGWIHWVFSTKGKSTDARLVIDGTEYEPGEPLTANVWHFYTPYFDLEGLEATINLYGGKKGRGGGLVISDYCPGDGNGFDPEDINVSKTAVTSYTREHFWDIDKKVETENEYEHEGYPKVWLYIDGSGDETATWTVDVTYEDYEDSGWNVSGTITIENDSTEDIMITSIIDELDGTEIEIDCGIELPYLLEAGLTLTCTYSEDGYVEGFNYVYVEYNVVDDDYTYEPSANAEIIWGDPTTENNATVNIKDISDLFGEVDLGTVTAPNDGQFTYTKDFEWEDYGVDGCGDFVYDNTATIVETGDSASATLKVNVQCYVYETAYAKGDDAICFIEEGFIQWGWTNPIKLGTTYEWDLWAAAGLCDTDKGTLVGSVTVYGCEVTYNVGSPFILDETHVYIGCTQFPQVLKGKKLVDTVAPGSYYIDCECEGDKYVIAHAVVGIPDPDFGSE